MLRKPFLRIRLSMKMKLMLKLLLEKQLPFIVAAYSSMNNRRIFRKRFAALHKNVRERVYGNEKITVLSGPFKGLTYFDEIVWGPITPKWLGCYEIELSDIIVEITERNYETVLDIGCAEGYYAIGLASRLPKAMVFAYDADFMSRKQTRRLARLNNVQDRVVLGGYCSNREIQRRATGKTLVVCDIEGCERDLLDPLLSPALSKADLLVEVHERGLSPSTLELLRERFAQSHLVTEVSVATQSARLDSIAKAISGIDIDQGLLMQAVNECRNKGQKWLWFKRQSQEVPAGC
jgi:hypothetical protein